MLDQAADVRRWARDCAQAENKFSLPEGKHLLTNSLVCVEDKLFNCCKLLPTHERYCKLFPDQTERDAGIQPGTEQKVFEVSGKRFKVLICYDLPHLNAIPTEGLHFLLFIYHFTEKNFSRVAGEIKEVSFSRKLPVLACSLVSDMNNGFSSYVNGHVIVSLSNQEGILEVDMG